MSARNQLCTCGSGKLYRKCCGAKDKKTPAVNLITLPDGQQLPLEQALQGAIALHQAGKVRRAALVYRCILDKKPRHADTLHLLGLTERALGNLQQAAELIRQAIGINDKTALYHSNLAQVLCGMNQPQEAEKSGRHAIQTDASLPEAHLNLGNALRMQNKADKAVDAFNQTLKLRPHYIDALIAKGDALQMNKQLDEALTCYQQALVFDASNVAGLTRVGINLRAQNKLDDAIAHYEAAIQRFPSIPELYYNLALVYKKSGNNDQAISSMKQFLTLRPDDAAAKHMLATYEGNTTDAAPDQYVKDLFDMYAENFDQHLVNKLEYKTPLLIYEMLKKHITPNQKYNILDLGCGTGLAGEHMKDIACSMAGVDLSPKMIAKAQERNIYTSLLVDSIEHYFEISTFRPDIVVSADVFVYIGDLKTIFGLIANTIANNGLFIFSIETNTESPSFTLCESGRYAHNFSYIQSLASQFSFKILESINTVIRHEHGKPVHGMVFLLKATSQCH